MDQSVSIVKLETRPHRVVARENWGLPIEQMIGMEVHHLVPVSRGGTNDPSNLYVCSPSMHRWGWHNGEEFIGWGARASEGRDKGEHKETSRKAAYLTLELGVGIHGMSPKKLRESASKAGSIGGKLPWWYNPDTGKTTRAKKSPGESWQLGRRPDLMTDLIKNLKPELANSQLYKDPDHPELGSHSAGTLVQMQTRRGYPHGKENRIKAGVKPSKKP